MKIGIMVDQLVIGSAPKSIGQEVKGLLSLGHDSEAVVLKKGYSPTYSYHLDGVPIKCLSDDFLALAKNLDFKFPGFSFFSMHHLTSGLCAPSVVQDKEWDMLVVHAGYTCFAAQSLYKKRGIPYLSFMWDPASYILPKVYAESAMKPFFPLLVPLATRFDKYVVQNCEAVITCSTFHHGLLKTLTDKNIEVLVPGCVPVEKMTPLEEREDMMFTFDRWDVGSMPTMFLEVLERLDKRIKLVVGGFWYPETLKEEFVAEVERKGLKDRVTILGPLNEMQIIELCSKAKVHVHAVKEAFGMPSLEAAACGCPVIIPAGSGVNDVLKHGVHGFFPDREGNIDQFVEYADTIINNPAQAKEMGIQAWETAKQYSWAEHARRLEEIVSRYVK